MTTSHRAPSTPRQFPAGTAQSEKEMLTAWLDFHRTTLLLKCEGADSAALRTASVPPSPLTLLGLVRHMAEVERSWFRRVFAGEDAPPLFHTEDDPDADFRVTDETDQEEAFTAWRRETERAREITAAHPLEQTGARRRHDTDISLRWVMLHLIEEYARHNGHADLLRERLDGATGV